MLSLKQMLLAGFGAILVGSLGALGWDIYLAGKEAVSVSIVGSNIPVHLLAFGAIAIAGLALLLLALWKNRSEKMTIEPRFAHLTIHYSQRTDTPDTPNPARPRFVVDNRRKRYYWVSTWLEPYIKQHKINWHTHDGEKALRTWLKKEKIEPHEIDPSPEDLDLENLLETDRLSAEPTKPQLEWYKSNREDKKEKRRAWKQRILTAYNAYIDSLASIKYGSSGVYPSGYCINDYGWPDVPHRQEAEAFLNKISYYEDWKSRVQRWNDYIVSHKTRNRTEVDNEFRQKIIAVLSKSGIPRKQEESAINRNYADYEYFATRIETCWEEGNGWSYSVGRLRQTGHADNPDDEVLQKLVDTITNLISGHLKQEYKEALNKLEKDLEAQNQTKSEKWNDLLKGRNDFLAKLKQLHDDIDAERVGNGAK